jgi:uncharacterized coiled-coil DUF342 family protein
MNTNQRRAYQEKADAQLRVWSAKIDELRSKAEMKRAEGKIDYYNRIEKLNANRSAATGQLAELKTATGDLWEDLKDGFDDVRDGLSLAIDTVAKGFRDRDKASSPPPPDGGGHTRASH